MSSMCENTWLPRLPKAVAVVLVLSAGFGCGRQVGYVGREIANRGDAGADVFFSDFQRNDGDWTIETGLPRAAVSFGRADVQADDGNLAELLFPGNANFGSMDGAGPEFVTQISTVDRFHFGTLRTKVSFGACDRSESVVQAVLGYFNDGTDANGNGIVDDVEIDFQIGCDAPSYAFMSVFTDYEDSASGPRFRKLSHIVDFSTGAQFDTPADDADGFVASGTDARLIRPRLVAANTPYELGFDWQPSAIRFFMLDGTEELTLWTLNDAKHVPQLPVHLMYNLWHPSSHWFPFDGEAKFPANDLIMKLDWVRFEPK